MGSQDVGNLYVKINEEFVLWSKEGYQNEEWLTAVITIPAPAVR